MMDDDDDDDDYDYDCAAVDGKCDRINRLGDDLPTLRFAHDRFHMTLPRLEPGPPQGVSSSLLSYLK
jgi:hypothetical protein